MMKYKLRPELKIVLYFVGILIAIFVVASFVQYLSTGTSLFENLAIVFTEKCSGSLSLSTTGTECVVKARIITSRCNGKTYQIRETSCLGNVKCYGIINYDSFQASCAWSDSGSHKYVLCVDNRQKDSGTVTCKQ